MEKNQVKEEKKVSSQTILEKGKEQAKEKKEPQKQTTEEKLKNAEQQIETLQKEAKEMQDKFMRTYAEMENIRKRAQNEIEKNAKIAIADFALDLLPVADNLERALSQVVPDEVKDNPFMKSLREGVAMTQKQLFTALNKNGVVAIESVGKSFDPNTQKAIQEVIDPTKESGTVIQEWQKGYTIAGNRVLREAMVIVSKKE